MYTENVKKVSLADIAVMARACNCNKITGHWTAGWYGQFYDDYHINIDSDGTVYIPHNANNGKYNDFDDLLAHTYGRNTGNIGISLTCCPDAVVYTDGRVNFGENPPTLAQIDSIAKVVAVICDNAPRIAQFGVTATTVKTHSEWAELDGYGLNSGDPDMRWDLIKLPDAGYDDIKQGGYVIRGKAIWHNYNNPDVKMLKI